MRKYRKLGAIGIAVLLTLSCAACGKQKVNYNIEDEGNTENQATGTDAGSENNGNMQGAQFADTDRWETTLEVERAEGQDAVINISADVIVPDTDSLSVVSVKKTELDNDFKKDLAGRLFGSEAVYVYGMEAPTKAYLEERISLLEQTISEEKSMLEEEKELAGEDSSNGEFINDLEEEIAWAQNRINRYNEMLQSAPSDWEKVTADFHEYEYIGERDGINYVLEFDDMNKPGEEDDRVDESETDFWISRNPKYVRLRPEDYSQICPEEIKDGTDIHVYGEGWLECDGENQCSISEEDAIREAEQFLNYLGVSDMVYTGSVPLTWTDLATGIAVKDGYNLTFTRNINDVSVSDIEVGSNYWIYQNGIKDYINNQKSLITVDINDMGIIGFEYENPMEQTNVVENVTILPFQNIQEIMMDYLVQDFEELCTERLDAATTYKFNKMELRYLCVKDYDTEDEYKFIPVWQLAYITEWDSMDEGEVFENIETCLIINAIDGSKIDIEEEVYGMTEE